MEKGFSSFELRSVDSDLSGATVEPYHSVRLAATTLRVRVPNERWEWGRSGGIAILEH